MNIFADINIVPERTSTPELDAVVQRALQVEARALLQLSERPPQDISRAVKLIHDASGPLIVAGVGKSGHIARKIASTFRSLGKRSAFLHAAEASHGDLGIIHDDSVVLVLSNSGETTELADLLAFCREYRVPVVGITGSRDSTLGKTSQIVIAHGRIQEACVNGLAPTTSTTVALAIGDALAVGVSHLSKIEPQDFRRYHPGGKLGTRLLKVKDLMHTGDALPIVAPDLPMQEVVITMSAKGFGVALVCNDQNIIGLITDGDMRRNVERLWEKTAREIATPNPVIIAEDRLATDAAELISVEGITACVVTGADGQLRGLLHFHDCLRAGVTA